MDYDSTYRPTQITALKVEQWLDEWEQIDFDEKERRSRPQNCFYIFSLAAKDLKALSGIQRRTTQKGLARSADTGVQRRHDESRSTKIAQYIQYGYPWSELSEVKRKTGNYNDLRKPGWLPTSIVVNILKLGDRRMGNREVDQNDLINIEETSNSITTLKLPSSYSNPKWQPSGLYPIEVIDGQHRLWAFDDQELSGQFELPVVAFYGLDISWQAYLFWSINITPKKINPSFAFDLYPLLRTEDWLEKFEGHPVYRETRAQELTEALWANPASPWYQHINMLGESGTAKMVSQAAWIRSLMATYVKGWESGRIGGLFGTPLRQNEQVLPWTRAQQAAFLIMMGQVMRDAIRDTKPAWAVGLRDETMSDMFKPDFEIAFTGPQSLLNTDQGIRALLYITNDLTYVNAQALELEDWNNENIVEDPSGASVEVVQTSLETLKGRDIETFMKQIANELVQWDWRAASALKGQAKTDKMVFRGAGGYRELRRQLLHFLAKSDNQVGSSAKDVLKRLEFE